MKYIKVILLIIVIICLNKITAAQTTISPTLNIVAGTLGIAGNDGDGGLATSAKVSSPFAVTVNKNNGDIYFVDYGVGTIRKIEHSSGIISTVAGLGIDESDGILASNSKLYPVSVLIDHSGRYLYIGQQFNARIRRIDLNTGYISTIAGTGTLGYSGDGGLATNAEIGTYQYGISEDNAGNIYLSDILDFGISGTLIRKIDHSTGFISTIAGTGIAGYSGDGGSASSATLGTIICTYIDADNNLYLPDYENYVVRKIDLNTGIITTIAGTGTSGYSGDGGLAISTNLDQPTSVSSDASGNIYISDYVSGSIRKIDRTGIITTICQNIPSVNNFIGIAKDIDNNLILPDYSNYIIGKLSIGKTPIISLSNPIATLTSNCAGIPSSPISVTFLGSDLSSKVTVFAPSGFEVSTVSNTSFESSISISPDGSNSVSSTIYIRLSSSATTNGANGTITATSLGATSVTTTVSSTTVAAPTFSVTGPYTVCSEGTYAVSLTVANSYNGWYVSNNAITVNSSGYVTAGTTPGTYSVSYSDACAQTTSATVTVTSTSTLPAITDGLASYKFNNNPQGPLGLGNVIYMGYNGFNYSNTTRPTKPGFYRANNVSGTNAGCPITFYIFRCTTCPN